MITFSEMPGRIGNQLYQFAALLGAGERLGYEVRVPPFGRHDLGAYLCTDVEVLTDDERRRLRHLFVDWHLDYADDWLAIPDWTDLKGTFSSPRYFPSAVVFDHHFTLQPELVGAASAYLEALRDRAGCLVGMQVRRGDYVDHEQFAPVSDSDFYERAAEHFAGRDPLFLVTSDDPAWCRQRFDADTHLVVGGLGVRGEFAMLTLCDHLVIGNSTFAWWAAWLNRVPGCEVVAPRTWLATTRRPDQAPALVSRLSPWSAREIARVHRANKQLRYVDSERAPLPGGWLEL